MSRLDIPLLQGLFSYLSLTHYLAPEPLKLRPYGVIQIRLLLLLILAGDGSRLSANWTVAFNVSTPLT